MLKFLSVAALIALFSVPSFAQLREVSLGRVTVTNLQSDLEMKDFRDLCNVVAVKAVVRDEKATISWIGVEFSDRLANQRFNVNMTLQENQETPTYNLHGGWRCIDRFVVNAHSRGSFWRSSRIELIAIVDSRIVRPGPGPRPRPPVPGPGPGPRPPFPGERLTHPDGRNVIFLTDISVSEFADRHSNPPLPRPECGLDAIKLQSLEDGTTVYRVSVMFDDGTVTDLRAPSYISRNSETPWLDVGRDSRWGGSRCIRNIQVTGRSDDNWGRRDRPSRISVLGLRSNGRR